MPAADLENGVDLDLANLREMISQVTFAASTDDARPVLTGALVEIIDKGMTLAAADGFRLSVRKAELSNASERSVKAIIPARALSELARIAADDEELIKMILPADRSQAIFRGRDFELVSQLIDGAFPDYQGIIPTSHTSRAVLPTSEFLKACKAADIFARESAHSARLNITPGGEDGPGMVEVTATAAETGSNEITVDATVDGDPIEIAFNVRFLVDVLSVVESSSVALETSGPAAPGVIKPVGRDDFLHVVMPMHLGR